MSHIIPMVRSLSFAMCVLVGVSAFGAERAKVTVAPFVARDAASDSATAKLNQLVVDELKARTDMVDFITAPVSKTPSAGSTPIRRGPTAEVLAVVESGRKAFDELRFDDAVKDLRRGLDGLLGDPATADFALVSDAHVKLAASYFRMGAEKEAKSTLGDLARLAPSAALPPGFPPVFQRELERAKKRLEKTPRGQVSVEGPSGSTAFLDGRDLGMVPVLEENVVSGMHYMRVESSKGERWGQVVEVKAGVTKARATFTNTSTERAPINAASDPRISSPVDDAMVSRLQAFTKATGADFALFGAVLRLNDTQLQVGAALYSLKRNAVSLLSPIAIDTDVLTANTEVFKLCDEAIRRAINFGTPTAVPIDLMLHKPLPVAAPGPVPVKSTDDIEVVAPTRRPNLTPRPAPSRGVNAITVPPDVAEVQPEVKSGVPGWVWVVTSIVVIGGAAVGGYFVVTTVTKPVTGTVNATW